MRKLFVVCLALASFFACQEAPKNNAPGNPQAELAAITAMVIDFYNWYTYEVNSEAINYDYIDSKGEFSKLDMAKVAAYHAQMMKSGFLSQTYIDNDLAYLKKYEAIWAKNKENGNELPLSGERPDRILCGLDSNPYNIVSKLKIDLIGTNKAKTTRGNSKLELVKENGKWLISKIYCF